MVSYAQLKIAIGTILLGWAQFGMKGDAAQKRKKVTNFGFVVLVIGLVGMLVVVQNTVPFLGNPVPGLEALAIGQGATQITPTDEGTTQIISGVCPPGSVEDVTVTLAASDKATGTATGGTHRYRLNGAPALTVSDAGTLTASAGATIEVLWMNASTSADFYSAVTSHTLACDKGAETLTTQLSNNGTISMQVFNEEGNLINGVAENETLAAGDVATLKFEIRGSSKTATPYGGIITVELNGTAFDESNTEMSIGGVDLVKVTTPSVHTISNTVNKVVSFAVGAIEGSALQIGSITLDRDDSAGIVSTGDPVITYRANNYFINEDAQGAFTGPAIEDEDNVATMAQSISQFTVHVD